MATKATKEKAAPKTAKPATKKPAKAKKPIDPKPKPNNVAIQNGNSLKDSAEQEHAFRFASTAKDQFDVFLVHKSKKTEEKLGKVKKEGRFFIGTGPDGAWLDATDMTMGRAAERMYKAQKPQTKGKTLPAAPKPSSVSESSGKKEGADAPSKTPSKGAKTAKGKTNAPEGVEAAAKRFKWAAGLKPESIDRIKAEVEATKAELTGASFRRIVKRALYAEQGKTTLGPRKPKAPTLSEDDFAVLGRAVVALGKKKEGADLRLLVERLTGAKSD